MTDKPLNETLAASVLASLHQEESPLAYPPLYLSEQDALFRTTLERQAVPDKPDKPGFWETTINTALKYNSLVNVSKSLVQRIPDWAAPNHHDTDIPEGWHPFELENILDLPDNYWSYILNATSPKELALRRQQAFAEIASEQRLQQGGIIAQLLGVTLGTAASPETYAFSSLAAAKYAVLTKDIIMGAKALAPRLAAQSVLAEGLVQTGRLGGNVEEWVVDSLRDTAFGLGIFGLGKGLAFGARKGHIWQARKAVNATHQGIDIQVRVGPKGEYQGLKAQAAPGQGVSAEQVSLAQTFLDEGAVLNGLTGAVIGGLGKIPYLGSELIQGLTSPYATVRQFFNRVGNESVLTGMVERGEPRPITAQERFRLSMHEAIATSLQLHDLYQQHLGLKPGVVGSAKAVIKQFQEGLSASRSAFNREVYETVLTGSPSASKEVNEAARLVRETLDKLWQRYLQAYNLPADILPPRTSTHYLMRNYDLAAMVARPKEFVTTVATALQKQDQAIREHLYPLEQIQSRIKALNQELTTPGGRSKTVIERELRAERKALKQQQKTLIEQMRNGEIDPALLKERVFLTQAEHEELEALMQPVTRLTQQIEALQDELPHLPKAQQKAHRARIRALKAEQQDLLATLRGQAQQGAINPKLWFKNAQDQVVFRSLEEVPEFRALYDSHEARLEAAQNYYEQITGLSAEQVNEAILGRLQGYTGSDPTRQRTLLIPDMDLLNAGFLSTDLDQTLKTYARVVGKKTALKEVFQQANWNEGIKDLADQLLKEHEQRLSHIEQTLSGAAKEKARLKENRQFLKEKQRLNYAYSAFIGAKPMHAGLYRFDKLARNWSAVTMLNQVPLLQVGELPALIFKQGFQAVLTGGLLPLLRRVGNKAANQTYQTNASHALVGLEVELSKFRNALFEGSSLDHLPGTWFERFTDKAAQAASTVFLTAPITNAMQRLSANITQSRVMSDLFAAAEGKLSKAAQQRLLMGGINPKDAARFIEQYRQAGGHSLHGGYVSNWHLWKDSQLQSAMRNAIHHDIQGALLEPGIFDKPFWARQPIAGLPFQFMGYLYAAFNKFTVPTLQRLEGQQLAALALMIGYGALIEPMRAFIKGQPFELNTEQQLDQWLWSGIVESGVLGYPAEFLSMLDALTTPPFLDRYRQDKFRRRSPQGIIAGPFGGLANNLFDVLTMFADGKLNERDVMKLRRVAPIPINLALDAFLTRSIKQLQLPPTRQDADYYDWVDRD